MTYRCGNGSSFARLQILPVHRRQSSDGTRAETDEQVEYEHRGE